jgi:hypothetical protein
VTPNAGPTLVSGITLTSANDAPERDPATYWLQGSLDGTNFYTISSNSVPAFPTRFYKNYIFFENHRAYKAYRLIFPTVVNAPNSANSMQIAEVELLGVAADLPQDVTQPGDPIVPSSNNNPGSEGVANAIDNVTGTKYLNFDAANNALPTGFTVSPQSGLTLVSGLTLTSANDAPERDPSSFVLSGSYDGSNFVQIASNSVPVFTNRFVKQTILFDNNIPYLHYRLMFPTVVNAPNAANSMQIAEVELLGVLAPTDVTIPGDPIVPSSNNNPGSEGVANAIDNVTGTKYLNFDAANNALPTGFTVTPGVGDTIVNGLTLTSANDAPERDPSSYQLQGSVDGINFLPISSGPVPAFPTRFFKNYIFFPSNTVAYKTYRLMFPTVVNGPNAANSMQIAEVELLGFTPGAINTNAVNNLIRRQPTDTPVLLGSTATFRVDLTGPWKVQWYTNGVRIPGANNASYTTPAATVADDGTIFYAVVQSPQGQQESDHVMLSIFTPSATESIGLSWQGAGANGTPTAIHPDDITGFHKQAYWNNISGGSGTLATTTNSNDQLNPTVAVNWATSGEWGAGTDANTPTGRMLNGIDTVTGTDSNTASTVTFSGVPSGIHSLLIYTVQVPLEFFNMNFQVITHDGGGNEIIQERFIRPQNSDEYNPSPGFILVTATVATNRSVGNMMRFDNLQPGPDGVILVRAWAPGRADLGGGQPIRGPGINGMQLLLSPGVVQEPPVITQQPVSKNGAVDGQVALNVTATGTGLTYQWLKNGQAIAGATNSQLVIFQLNTNDIANYSVAIENSAGRVVSRPAFVDVLASEQITEGLIFYYKFDDEGGIVNNATMTDYSGHGVDGGVRGNTAPDWPPGISGGSLNFDGLAYGVTPDYPKPSAAMSISAWVFPTSPAGPIMNDWIASNPIGSRGQFQLDLDSFGALNGRIAVGPNVPVVTAPVTANPTWHHVALTANGTTLTLYWDGVAVDTADYLGKINNSGSAIPVPWVALGATLTTDTNVAPAQLFTGQMDDVALFGRSLSDEEISAIYNNGLAGRALSDVPPVITASPRLNITRSGNSVTISWRSDFEGFTLKSTTDLINPVWTDVPGVVNNSVTIQSPTGNVYFRLEK